MPDVAMLQEFLAGGEVVPSPEMPEPAPSSSFSTRISLPVLCGTVMDVFSEKRRLVICSSPIFCSSACRFAGSTAEPCGVAVNRTGANLGVPATAAEVPAISTRTSAQTAMTARRIRFTDHPILRIS